jgi:type I restriction enzyme M protein
MLDTTTKRRIDTARDILVGKVPDPKSQVEQITIALIYKFMDDMDLEAEELGGVRSFFTSEYEKYSWHKLFDPSLGGFDVLTLYSEALLKLSLNPAFPQLFRDIFKNAYLPYRDPETLKSFIKIINDFNYDHSEKLGDAFEYLLSVLGSQGDAGQFRTPRHIIDFMVTLVDPQKNESILDPACGTAGFLISAYKHIRKNNSSNYDPAIDKPLFAIPDARIEELGAMNGKYYTGDKLTPEERSRLIENICGYDISPDMVRLSLVNLYLHGFTEPHIYEYDTLTSEDRWNEYYDIIMANPPFMSPKGGIKPHKRFSMESSRSEVLFVDYIAEHLKPTGKAAIIVPEGIIFQGGTAYKQLRKMLVEENYLVGVISLPAGVFNPYSGVKTSILWIDKSLARKTDKVLFVKITNDGFDLGAQRRPIKQNDLPDAINSLSEYRKSLRTGEAFTPESDSNISLISKERLSANGEYVLTGDRYKIQQFNLEPVFPLVEIGNLCTLINGIAFKPEDWELPDKGGLPIIRIQNLNNPGAGYNYYSGTLPDKTYVNTGDLLFSWSGSRGTSFGAHVWKGSKAILNQHIFRVEHDDRILRDYLHIALNKAVTEIEQNLHGGVGLVHITKGNLERIKIPLPSIPIQKEIITEIENYQKIIDGARQVVENYKPRIDIDPEWPKAELGSLCELIGGGTPSKSESTFWQNGSVKWISSKHINDEGKVVGYDLITKDAVINSSTKILPSGSTIIITRVSVGKVAYADDDFAINQDLTGLITKDRNRLNDRFLFYCSRSLGEIIDKNAQGIGVRGVTRGFLSGLTIPLPSIEKQNLIVSNIEEEQHLVEANKRLIELYSQKIKDRIAKVWGE